MDDPIGKIALGFVRNEKWLNEGVRMVILT